jgi:serine/threonine-protein kinase
MARIYIARSTGIGSFERHVVLKLILPERAQDETSVQMFLDEARLAASLNHQNVAQVFEVGREAGIHYLAMEYVHGQDLRALLARAGSAGTRVPLELALTIVAGAAAGLEHAHERRNSDGTPMGIVHRDVSPSNIMIGYDGAVKLLDFGIAKATSRSIETQSGVIKGKFAYMAPEQCRGRDVDRRSDVFSLGIILYEVTTQHRCFRADSDFDTMHRIVTGDIMRPSRLIQGYPQALEAIVMKALATDAAQRYQSAAQLLEALEAYATTTRMSMSTMTLGRFMRDMFGDVPEPWLVTGRFQQVVDAREQTISNTNASGDHLQPPRAPSPSSPVSPSHPALQWPRSPSSSAAPLPPPPRPPSSPPAPALRRPSSPSSASSPALRPPPPPPSASSPALQRPSSPASPGMQAQQHQDAPLHLPPDIPFELPPEHAAASPEWNAHGYPAGLPAHAAGSPAELLLPTISSPSATASGVRLPIGTPHHFTELSRSESGPAHSALVHGSQPIARTRQGYANAPAMSRSELSPRFDASELDGNISLQPSNRWLYIGLGVVLVGIIVLLAVAIVDGPAELPGPSARPAPRTGAVPLKPDAVKPEAFRDPALNAGGVDPAPGPAAGGRRTAVHVRVVSTPPGAEVSLSGKPLGVTPLDVDTERRTGTEVLTIHRARYRDISAAIDLTRDYESTVTLQPIPEPAAVKPAGGERDPRAAPRDRPPVRDAKPRGQPANAPAKDDCQPPDKINPYENACHGHVCKPCPTQ